MARVPLGTRSVAGEKIRIAIGKQLVCGPGRRTSRLACGIALRAQPLRIIELVFFPDHAPPHTMADVLPRSELEQ